MSKQHTFDSAAQHYDQDFTNSMIGKKQRNRVYYWLNKINFFKVPKRVFEVNCGTGYDAEYFTNKGHSVIATDGSEKMVEYAKKHRNNYIDFFPLEFNQVANNEKLTQSNVLFSNFGGLNCISNTQLQKFTKGVAQKQRKKDLLIWVIMPKFCFIETLYFVLKFDFKNAFRRNIHNSIPVNVEGESINTYYHSPSEVKEILNPYYTITKIKPVAFFLPPSYMETFFKNHTFTLEVLNKLEVLLGRCSFLSGLSDHYIIIAEKR